MKILFTTFFLLIFVFGATSQETESFFSFQHKRLNAIGNDMVECLNESERLEALNLFQQYLDETLESDSSFELSLLEKVKNLSILTPDDKKFKLITYAFRYDSDSFVFFGLLQFKDISKPLVRFVDKGYELKNEQLREEVHDASQWPGCLYYKLIEAGKKKDKYYVLLGWNGFTSFSNRKIIEVLSFDEEGAPVFGKPVFNMNSQPVALPRVIFEYSNDAVMALHYEKQKNLIAFEYLHPPSPQAVGKFNLYLPDGTYDYLVYKKGIWQHNSMYFGDIKDSEKN